MYLFLCLHLLITSDLLFSMLSSPCRAITSSSLWHRRHHIELWLYDLWVSKISQDMFEVLFTAIIFQYSFDNSVSVWYLILLNVLFMVCISDLICCFTKTIINFCFRIFFVWCDTCFVKDIIAWTFFVKWPLVFSVAIACSCNNILWKVGYLFLCL